MRSRPRSRWFSPIVLAMTVGTCRATAQVAPRVLPVRDQVEIFTDALLATAAMQEHYGLPKIFVLIPLTEVDVTDSTASKEGRRLVALDTAVSGALLRAGAVVGLCVPSPEARRCANEQRGVGVFLSTFGASWSDSARVNVQVTL